VRPNPDSRAHQQAAAADTKEEPAVAVMAAGTAAWRQAAAAAAVRFTSPTSVVSLSYINFVGPTWMNCIDWTLAPIYHRMAGFEGLVPPGW
jgi:hypothetical protein